MPILVVSWVRRCRKREWTTARQIGIAVLERFSASHAIAYTPTHTKCRPFSSRPMLTMDRKCPQSIHLKVNCYASLSDNPIKHADQRCQQAISRGSTRIGKRSKKKADAFRKKGCGWVGTLLIEIEFPISIPIERGKRNSGKPTEKKQQHNVPNRRKQKEKTDVKDNKGQTKERDFSIHPKSRFCSNVCIQLHIDRLVRQRIVSPQN